MIEAKSVSKIFGEGNTEVRALRDIDLSVKKGEFVAICGPSGCGKSTLLNILGCLEKPTGGKVFIDGKDVSVLKESELAEIRREKIGFIFQNYNLIGSMTALENVKLAAVLAGKNDGETNDRAAELLEKVGMSHRIKHKPAQLSGGEQQRVAVARALMNDPALIIGDEPTGNLDSKTGKDVSDILLKLNKEQERTVILVTHDAQVASMADRTVYIKDGRFVQSAKKEILQ